MDFSIGWTLIAWVLIACAAVGVINNAAADPPFRISVTVQSEPDRDPQLRLHLPLQGDASERVQGSSAIVRGKVDLSAAGPSASIRGAGNWIALPGDQVPQLGTGDFSVALWIQADDDTDLLPGDLISQYDSTRRRGFHVTLKCSPGVTSNQANWRQLQFGIDNNQNTSWRDCARPGNGLFAFSLASHAGKLYAGMCEPGIDQSGRVYRYEGDNSWTDCGSPDKSNSVTSLAEFSGKLYAGTGKYRLAGSALPESPNGTLGGRVFRYARDGQWIDCGQLPGTEAVGGLVVFRGRLYASSLYRPAGLFLYEGDTRWSACETPGGKRVVSLTVHDGYLYAGSYDGGHVYRYDGQHWTDCGQLGTNTQTYSFVSYEGELLVGTWPSGHVHRFCDLGEWSDLGRLGEELEVMGMVVHNGRLLAGTLPLAEVYSYEGSAGWRRLARLDHTPDVKYRRAWTIAEHGGELFCSTLPSGKVFAFSAGRQVMHGERLSAEWHHVTAIRSAGRLQLFVDGVSVAESPPFDGDAYDLTSNAPLRIGRGANGPFNGRMADVRIYVRALAESEIRQLASVAPAR